MLEGFSPSVFFYLSIACIFLFAWMLRPAFRFVDADHWGSLTYFVDVTLFIGSNHV
jgi:hypothetical protein